MHWKSISDGLSTWWPGYSAYNTIFGSSISNTMHAYIVPLLYNIDFEIEGEVGGGA